MSSMLRSVSCVVALGGGAMVTLQGCGGGGDDAGTTTTTTTTTPGPTPDPKTGNYWCEDIPTYRMVHNAVNGTVKTVSAAGQCLPSATPGAYFTKSVPPVAGQDAAVWQCLSPQSPKPWNNAAAKAGGYEGYCVFKDYSSKVTPDAVPDCTTIQKEHPALCAPGPDTFWGACYLKDKETAAATQNWKCVPKSDPTIKGLAKGDCKSQVPNKPDGGPEDYFYDGVCAFKPEKKVIYKCETVPGYQASESLTCGQSVDITNDNACFSLTSTTQWQCTAIGSVPPQKCDWTPSPSASKEFYTGYCVFAKNPEYKDAIDYPKQSVIV